MSRVQHPDSEIIRRGSLSISLLVGMEISVFCLPKITVQRNQSCLKVEILSLSLYNLEIDCHYSVYDGRVSHEF
jgi:hypothetical protein